MSLRKKWELADVKVRYDELTDDQKIELGLDTWRTYVELGQVTWDEMNTFRKEYWNTYRENEDDDEPGEVGRPIEYPESDYHRRNRAAQKRFHDKKKKMEAAKYKGHATSDELKERVMNVVRNLRMRSVDVVVGRISRILDDCESWEVEYAVDELVRTKYLRREKRCILLVPGKRE